MILIILGTIVYLIKSLDFLYLFQTKEYRLDRILSLFKEEGIFNLLYFRKIRLPAVSLRNLLIVQGIFFNIFPFYLLLKNSSFVYLLIFLLLSPMVAVLTMILGVMISEIPVQVYRKIIIIRAVHKVKNSKAVFIGITGSYGKTSTKEFLYQILSQKFKVAKTEKNYNSEVGVALSILKNLKPDTEYFIAELGAYKKGEIKAICRLIQPKYGILTGISNQHLDLFGSKKNLIEAKSELLEALPNDGTAYINKDIKEWKYFAEKTRAKKEFYSLNNLPSEIKTNLPGKHNLQNLLPCIALASQLGVEKSEIIKTVKNIKPISARLSIRKGLNQSTILDDSYNSNVEGFIAAINTASQMDFSQILILSRGLIELGAEKIPSYQRILEQLYRTDLILLTTDKLFKNLDKKNKVFAFSNERILLNYVKDHADRNTLLIIEGRFEPRTIATLCHSRSNRESI